MLISSALFAALAVVGVGFAIFWSNPSRPINRWVFSCSVHIALWLGLLNYTFGAADGLTWLRWTTSVAAFIPFHFWNVKESIINDAGMSRAAWIKRAGPWLTVSLALGLICFTEYFIPHTSTAARRLYGPGYYIYIAGVLGLYAALAIGAWRRLKTLTGVRRLEIQVWLGGGCVAAAAILTFMAIAAITREPRTVRLQPFVVLAYYASTSIAITTYRIFDARQILIVMAEKGALVTVTAAVAFLTDKVLSPVLPSPTDYLATTALTLWFAWSFNGWLDRWFQFYPEATQARQAAFTAAGRENRIEKLVEGFLPILRGWGQSEKATILCGKDGAIGNGDIVIDGDTSVIKTLDQIRWATPERLAREKPTPERDALARFLSEHGLGVLVASEGSRMKVLVGVGVPASRRPFTYPQVTQLIELAAIMHGAIERAQLSAKAQHAEQLATVGLLGASLAHEIRNPLVSIKTFVQLLPNHYQDQAFRDKFFKLIGDEVTRIDRLTEQLLDLASPRVYTASLVELHPVVRVGFELVASKAAGKNIELRQELGAAPDMAWTDPAAVKQVLLNLCFNAIQAVEMQVGERWVLVATRNTPDGVEMTVSDSGPGIATEIRPRLFQPFQSTKSSGFGLGLAICKDILGNLNATITVDAPVPGSGATFRVVFPCQPS